MAKNKITFYFLTASVLIFFLFCGIWYGRIGQTATCLNVKLVSCNATSCSCGAGWVTAQAASGPDGDDKDPDTSIAICTQNE